MHKIIILSMLLLGVSLQAQKVITVNNAEEFVNAIGSDRTIQLKGNTIFLNQVADLDLSGDNFRFERKHDGNELLISAVKNLKIVGMGKRPVKIITEPLYGEVIFFENCENITIENIDAGHGPEKGQCQGGVLKFENCSNVSINNSILYGSGTQGITANSVSNLKCTNTMIRGCTYHIMSLTDCSNISFTDCDFYDNQTYDLVNIKDCNNVSMNGCNFEMNNTDTKWEFSDYALFNISNSKVSVKDSYIFGNKCCHLAKGSKPEMLNTKLEMNSFSKGEFKK